MGVRLLAIVAVLALVVAAAGCGGDDGDDATQQWADDVCTDLNDWLTSVRATVEGVTAKGLGITQADIEAAVDDAKTATNQLASDLRALGTPDGEAVEQAKAELEQLADDVEEQVDNVEQAAASDAGPVQLAQTVGAAVSASVTAARSTFETIQSLDAEDELKSAFEDSEDCDTLRETIDDLG